MKNYTDFRAASPLAIHSMQELNGTRNAHQSTMAKALAADTKSLFTQPNV